MRLSVFWLILWFRVGRERRTASEKRLHGGYRVTRRRLLFPGRRFRQCAPGSVPVFPVPEMRAEIIRSALAVDVQAPQQDGFSESARPADATANLAATT